MSLSWPGCMPVSIRSRAEPSTVCVASVMAVLRSRPDPHAPVGERLDDQGDVGGAGAGEPGHRVHHLLVEDHDAADGLEDLPRRVQVAVLEPRGPRDGGGAFEHQRGRVRHDADDPGARRQVARIVAVDTPAATEIRSLPGVAGAISSSTAPMICGLTARMTTSAWRTSVGVVRDDDDAVEPLQLLEPIAPDVRHEEVPGRHRVPSS